MIRLALALSLIASPALAQVPCGPREVVVTNLADGFGETSAFFGLTPDGKIMELFLSPETGSWSVIMSMPDGTSCLVQIGEAGTFILAVKGDPA